MSFFTNPAIAADYYKIAHPHMQPPGTTRFILRGLPVAINITPAARKPSFSVISTPSAASSSTSSKRTSSASRLKFLKKSSAI